ncbi:MAG TPA: epimerase [Spirochaetaceae bacterium]|nr:MAG: hypothetical protein A2Y32_06815 [Spirochaetes bacterium GWF1_60_12]HAW85448.1 epimerase [Spirochaetaceae bacterium]HBO41200.1 epimerase [Spirochaetaceae bacterium]
MHSSIKTVLLTGATGFLGSNLLSGLLATGYNVVVVKRSHSRIDKIKDCLKATKVYNIDECGIEKPFKDNTIDAVLHVATMYARESTAFYDVVDSNISFGVRLLDLCSDFNVKLFVNTDTFSNDGDVTQTYLGSYILSKKQFAEWMFLRKFRYKTINLKLQHMYGPKDETSKFIPWVITQLANAPPFLDFTPGMQKRDFVYVEDVVSAYLKILECFDSLPQAFTYNVGTGIKTTLKDMIQQIRIAASFWITISTEFCFGALCYRAGEKLDVETDISPLRALGWEPLFDIATGLYKTVDYYLQNRLIKR